MTHYTSEMVRGMALGLMVVMAAQAHAVVVRGRVTDALGVALGGARVQLIRLDEGAGGGGTRSVADTISGFDGGYEIRSGASGRFLLLTAPSALATGYAPQIGSPFYGGARDVLVMDVVLNASDITRQSSGLVTLTDVPLKQLAEVPVQVAADRLLTRATVLPEIRPNPGVFVVQFGQLGMPSQLFLRGAPVGKVLVDGVSAEELGGGFNLATVTSSGLAALASEPAIELGAGASPLRFLDAGAGVLSFETPRGATVHPTLTYVGDWGNLSTERNEGIVAVAHRRADALGSFSRLNTDNDLPAERLHLITSAANLGYYVSGATSLRLTLRDDVGATPLAVPFGFYNVQPSGKNAWQNLYSGLTFETRTLGGWHNLARFGMVRKRAEISSFSTVANGLPVTITGANGYSASGTATFPAMAAREDLVTNRDEGSYETDAPVKHYFKVLGEVRYQDERGADLTAGARETVERRHFSVVAEVQGEVRHRFFWEAAGFIDDGALLGVKGAPRVGVTYVPVRPGARRFRGTSVHATAAAGVREPTLQEQMAGAVAAPTSRTFDVAVDQEILPRKLSVRTAYFHNQFAHEMETLGLAPLTLGSGLAYRTQGLEVAGRYRPFARVLVEGGYTYLAAEVEQSGAVAVFNPGIAGVGIGALTALKGARPFHRPPETGFVMAAYSGTRMSASLKASFAGSSDDSTNLYLNKNLLLPNKGLSPGFADVDADFSYRLMKHVSVFSEFTNLLDERGMAPIGYLSAPFGVRVGVRIWVGRE